MDSFDLVIIGTGWFGLTIAKTYLEVHPDVKLLVLESADSVGGTWANHRLYPGLKSNNLLGTYESPDFPMSTENFEVSPDQHIPGHVIHDYLTQYAQNFGVWPKIRFNSKVAVVEPGLDDSWTLTIEDVTRNKKQTYYKINAHKLIVAAGVTGNPNMPKFDGQADFDAPLFHAKEFLQQKDLLETAKTVAVYGGAKSGWDAVYAYATAGVEVEWVIRESGRGPCWMAPPHVFPTHTWLEKLIFTRILVLFSPCWWGQADGYDWIRGLLHRTSIGRWFVDRFWKGLGSHVLALNGYDKHPETKKLKPWSDAMWSGTSLSILNYPTDFFEYVRNGKVRVHHADITKLSSHTVHLSTGQKFAVDALHCSTGWKHEPPIKFSPLELVSELGGPNSLGSGITSLTSKADAEIMTRFPRLKNQPNVFPKNKSVTGRPSDHGATGYRLYRFMIPPVYIEKRNIAFAGALLSLGQPVSAQMQALWLTAYFDGSLQIPKSVDQIQYDTELYNRFGKWRSPAGCGDRHADLVFETLPYYDELLRDLGMKYHRKGGVFKEMFSPYGPEDYKGIVQEWKKLQ